MKQKVLAINGFGRFVLVSRDLPAPKRGEVLVQVKSCLISPGTELGGIKSTRRHPVPDAPPRPFGYGNAGIVLRCGYGVKQFRKGDRVACGGGGAALHADRVCVPQNMVVKIPPKVSFDEAAFAQLGATALNAIRRAELEFGQYVAVAGLGVVGQLCCQLATLCGCHVMAVDSLPGRLAIAKRCGVEKTVNYKRRDPVAVAAEFSRGYGFDCGIIAFGGDATDACKTLCAMLKQAPDGHRYGNIVLVGGAHVTVSGATALGNADLRSAARTGPGYHDKKWHYGKDYPKALVEWTTRRNHEEVLLFAAQKKLDLKGIITDRVPLARGPEACEKLLRSPNDTVGVILKP